MTRAKKKPAAKKRQGSKKTSTKRRSQSPHIYVEPKTAAELGIVCTGGNSGESCAAPVVWFDYELGEKNHRQGFVCDEHKVSNRVEKLAQPTAASIV